MPRAVFSDTFFTSQPGSTTVQIAPYSSVALYNAGTSTPIVETIYQDATSGATYSNPFNADEFGHILFFLATSKRVKIVATAVGGGTFTFDYANVVLDPTSLFQDADTGHYLQDLLVGDTDTGTSYAVLDAQQDNFNFTQSPPSHVPSVVRAQLGAFSQSQELRPSDSQAMPSAVSGIVNIPASTTVVATNGGCMGITGQVRAHGNGRNGVALYGYALRTGAGGTASPRVSGVAGIWGCNIVTDDGGFTMHNAAFEVSMIGMENDMIMSTEDAVPWFYDMIGGSGTAQGTLATGIGNGRTLFGSVGYNVRAISNYNPSTFAPRPIKVNSGFKTQSGSCIYAIEIGAQESDNSICNSQPIILTSVLSVVPQATIAQIMCMSTGHLALRSGAVLSGEEAIEFQRYNIDQTAAGTKMGIISQTGLGINTSGLPARQLDVFMSAHVGMHLQGRFTNRDGNSGSGVVIGFNTAAGAETDATKTGIGAKRVGTQGVSELHFLMNIATDTSEISSFASHSVGFFASDKGLVIGTSTTSSNGAGTLSIQNGLHAAGASYIGSSNANTFNSQGLTINQGAFDDEIFTLKSSDIAHGMTSIADTDTYGSMHKGNPGNGGLLIRGFSKTNTGFFMQSFCTTEDSTITVASNGYYRFDAYLKSGTSNTNPTSARMHTVWASGGAAQMILDTGGGLYLHSPGVLHAGTTTTAVFDDYDDVGLLETFRTLTNGTPKNYKQSFAEDMDMYKDVLTKHGILTIDHEGEMYVSQQGIMGLIIDAIRQLSERIK